MQNHADEAGGGAWPDTEPIQRLPEDDIDDLEAPEHRDETEKHERVTLEVTLDGFQLCARALHVLSVYHPRAPTPVAPSESGPTSGAGRQLQTQRIPSGYAAFRKLVEAPGVEPSCTRASLDESRGVSRVSRTSASPGTRETRDENSLAGAVMMHAITRDEFMAR